MEEQTKATEPAPRKPRGFACLAPEVMRGIASAGGKASAPEQRMFRRDPEAARAAGRKGGAAGKGVLRPRKPRPDLDRELAALAGLRDGGQVDDGARLVLYRETLAVIAAGAKGARKLARETLRVEGA